MKRIAYIGLGSLCAWSMEATEPVLQKKSLSRPNVIYIFPDQMRNHALGFWQEPGFREAVNFQGDPVRTPNLDHFAKESVVLTSAFSNFPLSSPHRGMLLTGMYPTHNGISLNCSNIRPFSSIREDVPYISDVFSQAGYNCAYLGKSHIDYLGEESDPTQSRIVKWNDFIPQKNRHGFDYWYVSVGGNHHLHPKYWDSDSIYHEVEEWSPIHEAGKVIDYLRNKGNVRNEEKPFFLMLSINPPHTPYDQCLEEDYNLYKDIPLNQLLVRPNVDRNMRKTKSAPYYFASVTGVDRAFGMIVDELKRLGMDENTIVVFSSDHGETMCSQGVEDPKNSPYAESVNIPFILRYKGQIAPHIDNDLLLSVPDIMPTILGLCGLGDHIPSTVEGRNYADRFLGKKMKDLPKGALYIQNVNGPKDSKGIVRNYVPSKRGIKTKRYTLSLAIDPVTKKLIKSQLFDDEKDPYQMNNLSFEENKKVVQSLCQLMASLLKETSDPWYKERILSDMIPYE